MVIDLLRSSRQRLQARIGREVRSRRLTLRLSQDGLARSAGISRRTLVNLEAGRYTPSRRVAISLDRVLDSRGGTSA